MTANLELRRNIDKDNNDLEVLLAEEVAGNRWEANSTTACRQTRNRQWDISVTDVDRKVSFLRPLGGCSANK